MTMVIVNRTALPSTEISSRAISSQLAHDDKPPDILWFTFRLPEGMTPVKFCAIELNVVPLKVFLPIAPFTRKSL